MGKTKTLSVNGDSLLLHNNLSITFKQHKKALLPKETALTLTVEASILATASRINNKHVINKDIYASNFKLRVFTQF